MNPFTMPTNDMAASWLIFVTILLAIGVGVGCFALWFFVLRQPGKKHHRRRKRRHHRRMNPTLSETGGLPPPRQPGEPPRGV
jgi:hypothetical protein